MKAISVRWLEATDFKPARCKAYAEGGHSWIRSVGSDDKDHLDSERKTAQALADGLGWDDPMVCGWTRKEQVFVFVPALKHAMIIFDHAQETHPHFESLRGQQELDDLHNELVRCGLNPPKRIRRYQV